MKFPKKKWGDTPESLSGIAEAPESSIQSFTDDYLGWTKIPYFRFTDKMWKGLQKLTENEGWQWLWKEFRKAFGGKMPDNVCYQKVSEHYSLMFPMELKTQDIHGKAVGKLRGRQKNFAPRDGWAVLRSSKAVEESLSAFVQDAEMLKELFDRFGGVRQLCAFVRRHS